MQVMAGVGLMLVVASPVRPGQRVAEPTGGFDDQCGEQVLDFVAGQGDQRWLRRVLGAFGSGDDCAQGVREHREQGPAPPGQPAAEADRGRRARLRAARADTGSDDQSAGGPARHLHVLALDGAADSVPLRHTSTGPALSRATDPLYSAALVVHRDRHRSYCDAEAHELLVQPEHKERGAESDGKTPPPVLVQRMMPTCALRRRPERRPDVAGALRRSQGCRYHPGYSRIFEVGGVLAQQVAQFRGIDDFDAMHIFLYEMAADTYWVLWGGDVPS